MSVIGIEYIISDLVHVIRRAAVQSLVVVEVAPSRQRKRSPAQDLATRRSLARAAVILLAAVARPPTETETEAQAMHPRSPRESHVHGEF